MARDQLFTAAGGDRPDKANVLIVLTDGELSDDPRPQIDFKQFAEDISQDFEVSSHVMWKKYILFDKIY